MKIEEKYFTIVEIPIVRTNNKAEYAKLLRCIADLMEVVGNKRIELRCSLGVLDSDC